MCPEPQTFLLDNIAISDSLPIDWEVIAALPRESEQHHYQRANEELLQNLLLRDDVPQETEDMDVVVGHEQFKRLENRLDLLLSLVTEMMSEKGKLPLSQNVTLGSRGLCVQTEKDALTGLKNDALLKIQLYLDPQFPRPLTVCAQVTDVQAQSFTVIFGPLEERMQDLLDKYVFRQHRRAIALSRKSENS